MLQTYAKSQYEEMQVQTTPGRLVVMLYDGAVRFLRIGKEAMSRGEVESQGVNIGKAQNIICELLETLDPDTGDLAEQLAAIYRLWLKRLLVANAEDRADYLDEVIQQVSSLREAWEYAERDLRRPEMEEAGIVRATVDVGR